jgi:hypothetical protein
MYSTCAQVGTTPQSWMMDACSQQEGMTRPSLCSACKICHIGIATVVAVPCDADMFNQARPRAGSNTCHATRSASALLRQAKLIAALALITTHATCSGCHRSTHRSAPSSPVSPAPAVAEPLAHSRAYTRAASSKARCAQGTAQTINEFWAAPTTGRTGPDRLAQRT